MLISSCADVYHNLIKFICIKMRNIFISFEFILYLSECLSTSLLGTKDLGPSSDPETFHKTGYDERMSFIKNLFSFSKM